MKMAKKKRGRPSNIKIAHDKGFEDGKRLLKQCTENPKKCAEDMAYEICDNETKSPQEFNACWCGNQQAIEPEKAKNSFQCQNMKKAIAKKKRSK